MLGQEFDGNAYSIEKYGWKKTHDKTPPKTGKVIYVKRDPRDVAISVNKMFKNNFPDLENAVDYVLKGDESFAPKWEIGTWQENVDAYKDRPNTLICDYENWDEAEINRIAEFIKAGCDIEEVLTVTEESPVQHIVDDAGVGMYKEMPKELLNKMEDIV